MAAVVVANFESSALHRHDDGSSNYRTWKEQMLCLIESQGLLAFIDGSRSPPQPEDGQYHYAVWRRSDRQVQGWILGALSDSVAETVVNCNSARDVWLQLEINFPPPAVAAEPEPKPEPEPEPDWHQYLPQYKLALNGQWNNMFLNPGVNRARVAHTLETALHVAVAGGKPISFVRNLVNAMTDQSLAIRDRRGFNALHVAAWTGNLSAAKILVVRLPSLLFVASHDGYLPVHLAADSGHRETLDYLKSETDRNHNIPHPFAAARHGFLLLTYLMDADYFDMAVEFVEEYPGLARMSRGHYHSALRQIALRASVFCFKAKLNVYERFIYPLPRFTKIYDKKVMRHDALKLVECLCKHMGSLTYTEAANIYREAMLTAAKMGVAEVIEVIVDAFPAAIYTTDASTKQNFLHLAVKHRCDTVFNLIHQTGIHRYLYSNAIDTSGNS